MERYVVPSKTTPVYRVKDGFLRRARDRELVPGQSVPVGGQTTKLEDGGALTEVVPVLDELGREPKDPCFVKVRDLP